MSKTRNRRSSSTKKGKIAKVSTKKLVGRGKNKRKTAKRGKVQCGGNRLTNAFKSSTRKKVEGVQKKYQSMNNTQQAETEQNKTTYQQKLENLEKEYEIFKTRKKAEIKLQEEEVNNTSTPALKERRQKKLNDLKSELSKMEENYKTHIEELKIETEGKVQAFDNSYQTGKESSNERQVDETRDIYVKKYMKSIDPKMRNIKKLQSEIAKIFQDITKKNSLAGYKELPNLVQIRLSKILEKESNKNHSIFIEDITPLSEKTVVGTAGATGNPMHGNQASSETPIAEVNPTNQNKIANVVTDAKGQSMNWFPKDYSPSSLSNMFGLTYPKPSAKPVEVLKPIQETKFLVETDRRGDKIKAITPGEPVTNDNRIEGLKQVNSRYNNTMKSSDIRLGR